MDKFSKNIILILFSISLTLLVAEIIARVVYVKPWYEKLIEEQTRYDNLGVRNPNYSPLKPSNCKRVLILGDSFTYGAGVSDDSRIFPKKLEKQLNAEFFRQGEKIEILNGGISNSLTGDWVKLLEQVKDSFKPDVILIIFFLRDGTLTSSAGSFFGPIQKEIKLRYDRSVLYQNVYLFRLLREPLDRLYLSRKYSTTIRASYLGNPKQTIEWEKAKINIIKIQDIAKEIHVKVGLVVFPILVELNRNYPFKDVCDCIIKFGAEHHIPNLSLLPAFMGKNGPDLWVSPYNQHPNEQAHLIAASAIQPFLKDLLSPDK